MKRYALTLAVTLLTSISILAASKHPLLEQIRKTTHVTVQVTSIGDEKGKCSGTAIGPHAFLTASHCEIANKEISIDAKKVRIKGIMRDGNDHTIYLLDSKFYAYSLVSTTDKMEMGDHVFVIGNPGGFVAVYREGVVAGAMADRDNQARMLTLIDMNIFPGDSGAAVFNDKGEIVGVISASMMQTEKRDEFAWTFGLAACLPLSFSQIQLVTAQTWKSGDVLPE